MANAIPAAALAALIAGVVTSLLVPFVARIALVLHAVDYPGGRKSHPTAVPRLGGVAIGLGLACGPGALALINWHAWSVHVGKNDLAAVLVGCGMMFLLGVVDDLVGVSTVNKLLVQVAAALLVVGIGWEFRAVGLPGGMNLGLGAAGPVLTVVWIVGVTNAINLIDGLDGLASGVVAIIAASLLIYSFLQSSVFTMVLMAGVVGACMGFLRHNWAPAQIFLGDSGSLALGFMLAVASVHSSLKSSAAVAILVPILALGVPVMDTLLVMLVRFLERPKGRASNRVLRMFSADRNHLHHLMERHGASRRTIVRLIYLLVLLSCAMALLVGLSKSSGLGISLVLVEVGAIVVVRSLGFSRGARALAGQAREEMRLALERPRADEAPPEQE